MKRMTYWCDDGKGGGEWRANVRGMEVLGAEIDRLAAYEDTGLEPEEVRGLCEMDSRARMADLLRLDEYQALGAIGHLRELVQAERDGLLVELPCKRGDKVWRICGPKGRKFVAERTVLSVTLYELGKIEVFTTTSDWLGKTVFLTREEAEAALTQKQAIGG